MLTGLVLGGLGYFALRRYIQPGVFAPAAGLFVASGVAALLFAKALVVASGLRGQFTAATLRARLGKAEQTIAVRTALLVALALLQTVVFVAGAAAAVVAMHVFVGPHLA
jgi:hypothetical protein